MDARILLIGDYPPPYGGVAVHVQQLHQLLLERGATTKVLDIGKGGRPAPDVLPVHTLRGYGLALARFAAQGWLLHLHTSGNNPKSWGVVASVGAMPGRGGKVVTLHSGLIPAFLARSRVHGALARAALAGFDRVVAVSEAVRDALRSAGVPQAKLEVHPAFLRAAVRPGELPERFAEIRARRRPLIAYAHHASPIYGRDVIFRALGFARAALPELGLLVFGPGTHAVDFELAARRARVEGLIENLGELPHAQALAALSRCDVFVRPTTADGDAISVREALALNVPVVASDVAARPEGASLFRSGDAWELAAKLAEAYRRGPPNAPVADAGPALLRLYAGLAAREPQPAALRPSRA